MAINWPGSIFWRKQARESIKNISKWKIWNDQYQHIGLFIGDINNPLDLDKELVRAKKWVFVEASKEKFEGSIFIGQSLWTCNCEENFIQSRLFLECRKCGGSISESIRKFSCISEILKWNDIFLLMEEKEYEETDSRSSGYRISADN